MKKLPLQEQDSNLRSSGHEPDELPATLSCEIGRAPYGTRHCAHIKITQSDCVEAAGIEPAQSDTSTRSQPSISPQLPAVASWLEKINHGTQIANAQLRESNPEDSQGLLKRIANYHCNQHTAKCQH